MAWLSTHGVAMDPAVGLSIAAVVGVAWAIHATLERWSQSMGRQVSAALPAPTLRTAST